jgi:GntR family transcriptional regulator
MEVTKVTDFDGRIPIYLQIIGVVKRDIITGKLKEGEKLPSVREMSEKLKVNPNTIQRAYQELEREKITYTQRGMGTFIAGEKGKIAEIKMEMSKEVISAFINGMKGLGFQGKEIIDIVNEYLDKEEY